MSNQACASVPQYGVLSVHLIKGYYSNSKSFKEVKRLFHKKCYEELELKDSQLTEWSSSFLMVAQKSNKEKAIVTPSKKEDLKHTMNAIRLFVVSSII